MLYDVTQLGTSFALKTTKPLPCSEKKDALFKDKDVNLRNISLSIKICYTI